MGRQSEGSEKPLARSGQLRGHLTLVSVWCQIGTIVHGGFKQRYLLHYMPSSNIQGSHSPSVSHVEQACG